MGKKVIVMAASEAEAVRAALDEHNAWDDFDLVVVPDDEFDKIRENASAFLPEGKTLREVKIEDFVK